MDIELRGVERMNLASLLGISVCWPIEGTIAIGSKGDLFLAAWNSPETFVFKNTTFGAGIYIFDFNFDKFTQSTTATPSHTNAILPVASLETGINPLYIVMIAMSCVLIFLVALALIIYRYRAQTHLKRSDDEKTDSVFDTSTSTNSTLFTTVLPLAIPGYLELNEISFRIKNSIARGGFGEIFLVDILDDSISERVQATAAVAKSVQGN